MNMKKSVQVSMKKQNKSDDMEIEYDSENSWTPSTLSGISLINFCSSLIINILINSVFYNFL